MNNNKKQNHSPSCLSRMLFLFVAFAMAVCLSFNLYKPDRPLPTIVPASSSEPSFVVQVIRPREGLPLGGLLPPRFFGVDAHLGFESANEGANYSVEDNKVELTTDDWKLRLVFDRHGQLTAETEVVFDLIFENRVRRVRCSPCEPVIGNLETIQLQDSNELSGSFDVELSNCEDAETGKPLGWPPKPFVLHGSFDRLRAGSDSEKAPLNYLK